MAHFAKVIDGIVVDRHVLNNAVITDENGLEVEMLGQQFLAHLWGGEPSEYVQCSYNGNPIAGKDRGGYPLDGATWNGKKFIQPPMPKE
jgi:hypothetical protein